jgi:hypothetical protein
VNESAVFPFHFCAVKRIQHEYAIFLHLFLVLHIIGISLMVGTTVVEVVTFGAFRRRLKCDDPASIVLV